MKNGFSVLCGGIFLLLWEEVDNTIGKFYTKLYFCGDCFSEGMTYGQEMECDDSETFR